MTKAVNETKFKLADKFVEEFSGANATANVTVNKTIAAQDKKLEAAYEQEDMISDETNQDAEILKSIAYAEKKIGVKMDTPKKVRDPDQPYAPVKYDIENVQIDSQVRGDDGSTAPAAPWGFANKEFVLNKPVEAKVVATQQAYEAAKEADVDARNEANKASSAALFGHVTRARDSQAQGDFWHEPYQRRAKWAGRAEAV